MGPDDSPRVNHPHPGNGQAMGRYRQQYVYDEVGNILEMIHRGTDPDHPGWRRCYQYALDSNRLLSTGYQSDPFVSCDPDRRYAAEAVYPQKYRYDRHGNMSRMPHLPLMQWDFKDQLQASSKQERPDGGTPEITYYVYDAAGQRVRKVTERQAPPGKVPSRWKERIYLGGFEVYRQYNGDGETVKLERETLHVMDDQQRIALVETKTLDEGERGNSPTDLEVPLIRYQLNNHLGSSCVEVDDEGEVISYEEYYPYGSTSYLAAKQGIKPLKRYRYTSKERDDSTNFYYHGARYYSPWIGRWISTDPAGHIDELNLYIYVSNNPLKFIDKTGKYNELVHGALTFHLALAAGFTKKDAAIIALNTQAVDVDNRTRPTYHENGEEKVDWGNTLSGATTANHFDSESHALKDLQETIYNIRLEGTVGAIAIFGRELHTAEDVLFNGPHTRGRPGDILSVPFPVPGHGLYRTEKGNLSHVKNSFTDVPSENPVANKEQLEKIFMTLSKAAKARYGPNTPAPDQNYADSMIEMAISAKNKKDVELILDIKGVESTFEETLSYRELVILNNKTEGMVTGGVTWNIPADPGTWLVGVPESATIKTESNEQCGTPKKDIGTLHHEVDMYLVRSGYTSTF
jgi:RHS repeat-associated protein